MEIRIGTFIRIVESNRIMRITDITMSYAEITETWINTVSVIFPLEPVKDAAWFEPQTAFGAFNLESLLLEVANHDCIILSTDEYEYELIKSKKLA